MRRPPGFDKHDPEAPAGEDVLRRWSRRKQAARADAVQPQPDHTAPATGDEPPPLPPLETLHADSDYSGFMHPKVSDELRRVALRSLFRSAKFNLVDGLDDYAEDYRSFESLGAVVTADLRHHKERAALQRPDDEAPATAAEDSVQQSPSARASSANEPDSAQANTTHEFHRSADEDG